MNEQRLFVFLRHQPPSTLLALLQQAYRQLTVAQREQVFYALYQSLPASAINGEEVFQQISSFHQDSLAGQYYAPFELNSMNYSHVPEKTTAWFDALNDFLAESATLTAQGEHALAVECFGLLYQLIEHLEDGEEIVFAHEVGSWMISGDEKPYLAAYLSSLAAVTTPEVFTATVLPLIRRDRVHVDSGQVYAMASRVANKEQRAALHAAVKRQQVRTTRKP